MISIDTNILVYAHREGVVEHTKAKKAIERAVNCGDGWGLAWPVISEFWSVVTHPSCAGGGSPPKLAQRFLNQLIRDGSGEIWYPGPDFGPRLLQLVTDMGILGPRVFDVQIGLISYEAGATELWTHDHSFVAELGLRIVHPLD